MKKQLIPILNFHDIGPAVENGVYPEPLLDLCMSRLHKLGYQTCFPSNSESITYPKKPLIISFDDGYESMYEIAYPILQKYGFKAIVFIVSGNVKHRDRINSASWSTKPTMDWQQIRELSSNGFSIGSHTATHRRLSKISAHEIHTELTTSKNVIEHQLGQNINSIAYPYGQYNEAVVQTAQSEYLYGFTDELSMWSAGTSLLTIPRIDMAFFNRPILIDILCSSILPAYISARRLPHEWLQSRRHQ